MWNLRKDTQVLTGTAAKACVKYALISLMVMSSVAVEAQWRMIFPTGWEARWAFSTADGVCELGIQVPEYAHARFVGSAGADHADLSFELQAWRDDFARGEVMVASAAPGWHPEAGAHRVLGPVIHIPGGGVIAHEPMARNMLHQLQRGYWLGFARQTNFSAAHEIEPLLAAKDLRPALDEFMHCLQPPRRVSWAALSKSRVSYEVDAHRLTAADEALLRDIVAYVRADSGVTRIFVDGHTDASGANAHNARLSKHRAGGVRQYLIDAGLQPGMITERYHGARYPVASNKSAAGKARNRRTTIRLSREQSPTQHALAQTRSDKAQ